MGQHVGQVPWTEFWSSLLSCSTPQGFVACLNRTWELGIWSHSPFRQWRSVSMVSGVKKRFAWHGDVHLSGWCTDSVGRPRPPSVAIHPLGHRISFAVSQVIGTANVSLTPRWTEMQWGSGGGTQQEPVHRTWDRQQWSVNRQTKGN